MCHVPFLMDGHSQMDGKGITFFPNGQKFPHLFSSGRQFPPNFLPDRPLERPVLRPSSARFALRSASRSARFFTSSHSIRYEDAVYQLKQRSVTF